MTPLPFSEDYIIQYSSEGESEPQSDEMIKFSSTFEFDLVPIHPSYHISRCVRAKKRKRKQRKRT